MVPCPKCSVATKEFRTKEGIDINYCFDGCKGIWFDSLELAQTVLSKSNILKGPGGDWHGTKTKFPCPRCADQTLYEIEYYPEAPLLVDWCSSCSGVFLDKAELGKAKKLVQLREPFIERVKRGLEHLEDNGYKPLK